MACVAETMQQWSGFLLRDLSLCSCVLVLCIQLQQKSVGMSGALVDSDGFPRGDVDIYAVRKARNRIICTYVRMG